MEFSQSHDGGLIIWVGRDLVYRIFHHIEVFKQEVRVWEVKDTMLIVYLLPEGQVAGSVSGGIHIN